jgi:hypothetical protein
MLFSKYEEFYQAAYITGPTHNFLGLSFTNSMIADIEMIICRLPDNYNENNRLDINEVKAHVLLGLEHANNELGTNYKIDAIKFLINDSNRLKYYSLLSYHIVIRMHTKPFGY